jgi:uncharacterized membrane protein HdeD (DUF308 family)
MIPIVTGHWWALALRGVLAVLFALLAFAYPPATILILAVFIAAYLFLDGILAVVAGIRAAEQHKRWLPFALEGVADLIAAAIIYLDPAVLTVLVGIWAILTGALMLFPAFALPGGAGKWLFVVNGLVSLLLGIVILAEPAAGVIFIAVSLGIYALLFGIGLIALAFRVRALHRDAAP